MKHDIEELLAEAIMSSTPAIIVEGKDDISFYEMLSNSINKNILVDTIENIEGYEKGCTGIIDCIRDLQPKIKEREENKRFILGIIDQDSRFYRNEIPSFEGLFILKYYSYESHLLTAHQLKNIMTRITSIGERFLNNRSISFIENYIYLNLEELYYYSLEALKNACIKNYVSEVKYSDEPGKIFGKDFREHHLPKIMNKKEQLDNFALEKSISIKDIKYISKGKWILHIYCSLLLNIINILPEECTNGKIEQCQYCKTGQKNKCRWQLRTTYNVRQLIELFRTYFDKNEVEYITKRIEMLI